jgi:hypothetical protein
MEQLLPQVLDLFLASAHNGNRSRKLWMKNMCAHSESGVELTVRARVRVTKSAEASCFHKSKLFHLPIKHPNLNLMA